MKPTRRATPLVRVAAAALACWSIYELRGAFAAGTDWVRRWRLPKGSAVRVSLESTRDFALVPNGRGEFWIAASAEGGGGVRLRLYRGVEADGPESTAVEIPN